MEDFLNFFPRGGLFKFFSLREAFLNLFFFEKASWNFFSRGWLWNFFPYHTQSKSAWNFFFSRGNIFFPWRRGFKFFFLKKGLWKRPALKNTIFKFAFWAAVILCIEVKGQSPNCFLQETSWQPWLTQCMMMLCWQFSLFSKAQPNYNFENWNFKCRYLLRFFFLEYGLEIFLPWECSWNFFFSIFSDLPDH